VYQNSNIHSLETTLYISHTPIVVLRPTQSFLETQQQKRTFGSNSRLYIRLSCTCVLNHFRIDSKSKRNCMDPIADSSLSSWQGLLTSWKIELQLSVKWRHGMWNFRDKICVWKHQLTHKSHMHPGEPQSLCNRGYCQLKYKACCRKLKRQQTELRYTWNIKNYFATQSML
jgi:hypothetical protein